MFDRSRSLTELEGDDWGKANYPSHLVITCHRMRDKPLRDLSDDEVRMAIGQQFSLPILVPLALERLQQNPLLPGDFYQGAVLMSIFMVKPLFWTEHPELWQRANDIAAVFWSMAEELDESWHEVVEPDMREDYALFVQEKPGSSNPVHAADEEPRMTKVRG